MKLRRLAYLGALLTPVLLGCSDDATVLSVNINLSSDKLDRSNPAAWSAIQVSVAGKPLPTPIAIQTEQVTVEGMAEKATQVKARWFQRIDLPGGYQDGGVVTASATGAYKQTTSVGGMDTTMVISNFAFSTEKRAGDKDPTINVDPDAAVIEEVSAVFLNFNAPEPAAPVSGGSGGGGGMPAATGGAATGGATGGSATATGGTAPSTGGTAATTGGAAPMGMGGGGTTGNGGTASDGAGGGAGGNGGTTSNGGGRSGGGGAGKASAGSPGNM